VKALFSKTGASMFSAIDLTSASDILFLVTEGWTLIDLSLVILATFVIDYVIKMYLRNAENRIPR